SRPGTPRSRTTASCPRTTASTAGSGPSAARSCSSRSSASSSAGRRGSSGGARTRSPGPPPPVRLRRTSGWASSAGGASRFPRAPSTGPPAADERLRRWPFEVGVRDRVAVRVVGGEAERAVDPRLELLRDHVLEPVGLGVDRVDVQAQRLRQVELEQAVVADHLHGDALARLRQPRAAVRHVLEQAERRELLHHRRRRRRRDPLVAGDGRDRDSPARVLQLVDHLQVVLDRLRQGRLRHPPSLVTLLAWPRVAIRVGHSADPDDAFMFWALEAGRVDRRGLELEQVVSDIQTLNEWALEGRLEVTALSAGAYPHVADRYVLLPHGASMGDGYGPVLVAREELDPREVEIVVPGRLTTAYLVLRLALGEPRVRELPFDRILDE